MSRRRVLAVDFGDRRTGLAATDASGTVPLPLPVLRGLSDRECAEAIAHLARTRGTEVVAVGVPYGREGEIGPRAQRTLAFVGRLREVAPCEVVTVDEAHTTDEAHARLAQAGLQAARRKRLADSVAALVILERYLEGPTR